MLLYFLLVCLIFEEKSFIIPIIFLYLIWLYYLTVLKNFSLSSVLSSLNMKFEYLCLDMQFFIW
jgi:hypothetical protein